MSWDILVCKFSRTYSSSEEIGDEWGLPLGTREEIQAAVSRVFPGTNWADPVWGVYDAPFGSIEFSLGERDPIDAMVLKVRASEAVIPPIVQLCVQQCWQALDFGNGSFLEQSPVPEAGLRAWLSFRNQVLGKDGA